MPLPRTAVFFLVFNARREPPSRCRRGNRGSDSEVLGTSRSYAYRAQLSIEYAGVMGRVSDGKYPRLDHPSIHV